MKESTEEIAVLNPKSLAAARLAAQRIPVGMTGDYKPCLGLLPSGELLLVCFQTRELHDGKRQEDIFLFRSRDGGLTWSDRQRLDLAGREPYFTILTDGAILLTASQLPNDIRNDSGCSHLLPSYVHRSTDGGHTWTSTRFVGEGLPLPPMTLTTRNILELPDGTLLMGVSAGKYNDFLWRSKDRGQTWEQFAWCDTTDFQGLWPFFGEAVLWRTLSGRLLALARVDSNRIPIAGRSLPPDKAWDECDHLILCELAEGGRRMRQLSHFTEYGEMYPSILRLGGDRLLLTFTVRDLKPPLGVQAVFGNETADGFEFDFHHDRLVLDAKTPRGKISGGGFGPTLQLRDGTLATCYSYRGADGAVHTEVLRWRLPTG